MTLDIIQPIIDYIINAVGSLGYVGIFVLMAIESTILPLPSELVLIPAGVLVSNGQMSVIPIIILSTLGSLAGSLLMYALSFYYGRAIIEKYVEKYGKFIFVSETSVLKSELYFKKHGEITIFLSRLLPIIRHLISIPAGFSRMNLPKFIIYTTLGAMFWSIILVYIGYAFGLAIAEQNLKLITYLIIAVSMLIIAVYLVMKKNRN